MRYEKIMKEHSKFDDNCKTSLINFTETISTCPDLSTVMDYQTLQKVKNDLEKLNEFRIKEENSRLYQEFYVKVLNAEAKMERVTIVGSSGMGKTTLCRNSNICQQAIIEFKNGFVLFKNLNQPEILINDIDSDISPDQLNFLKNLADGNPTQKFSIKFGETSFFAKSIIITMQ